MVIGEFLPQRDFSLENRVKRKIAILSEKWPFWGLKSLFSSVNEQDLLIIM
tara:strand:- start:350 stop:502 length:153 start_codon:yes stop_codon:yes gene_type:complete